MSPPLAVLDIDGVLADVTHRLHYLDHRPKRWRDFFAEADRDTVLADGLRRALELAEDHEIRYLTGRPTMLRATTAAWLDRHGFPRGEIHMRQGRDFRPARITKLQALQRWRDAGREIAVVIDDDPQVVETLLSHGFRVEHARWAGETDQESPVGQLTLWQEQQEGRT